MNKSLFIFVFFIFSNVFSQTFSERAGQRVFINKKIISYSYFKSINKNGVTSKNTNKPSMSNPFNIFISSNDNNSSIRISSKKIREDIFLNFKGIYKMRNDENSTIYEFAGNKDCDANIVIYDNSEEHQNLYIKCIQENVSENLILTISKYDQL